MLKGKIARASLAVSPKTHDDTALKALTKLASA
jgi:hypothetical protein